MVFIYLKMVKYILTNYDTFNMYFTTLPDYKDIYI